MVDLTLPLQSLFNDGKFIKLARGETLHTPMEPCKSLGLVQKGRLGLTRLLSSGKSILINDFNPGDLYAELIVFSGENYPGWISAIEKTQVVELDLKNLLVLLKDSNTLVSFLAGISNKVINLTNTIEILCQKTVRQKISYYLLSNSGEGVSSSVSDLASRLGCSREALSRALSELVKDEVISRRRDTISIADETALENILFADNTAANG
jgi:CRP/FNR family transcriptional regulator, dissimilatory nitrate respiration regulator